MALDYDLDTHIKALESVLDDYTEWFLQVVRRLFYPGHDHEGRGQALVSPPSFENWVKDAEKSGDVSPDLLRALRDLHYDLCTRAEGLMVESVKQKASPPYKEFNKLAVLFEEFTGRIRRFEKDRLMGDSGVDTLTGLRSKDTMEKDIKREMDRLARQGKTFSLALVKIDDFELIRQAVSPEKLDEYIKIVAEFVKKTMRSFDDE